ncbi:MAG TPA: amidohydrolase [Terriglobales bacterium]|nr:amidohydrolase [Terriglobales bacterium]
MNRLSVFVLIPILLACAMSAPAIAGTCMDADLLLRNGHIVTMDSPPIVTAMAVRAGKILALGNDAELASCASSRTNVVDLGKRTVLPGLIDVHTHVMEWTKGILRGQIDAGYPKVHSIAEIVNAVGERAKTSAAGSWIVGSGWDDSKLAEHRYITRQDLDPVSPNNPVYLVHVSGHLGSVNSAALKAAGITKDTLDPQGGVIEHDHSGEPTGVLKDTAMELLAGLLPKDPPDIDMRAAKLISEKAAEVGLTTLHDIFISSDEMRGYQDAYARGWLKIRVQMSPQIGSIADAEKLAHMGVHTGFGDDRLKFGAAKMFADGGMGARTIAIYPPGVIGEPNNLGVLRWKPEDMQKAHLIAAAAGWQLETHAIGDRAIDEVLDSYAAVIKQLNLKDARFRIVHAGISTPAIQKRVHELGVVVDGNPPFVYWIGSWFQKYGAERVRWAYPARSYLDNGVLEAAGSDVDVTPLNPWWGIWAAVARKELQTGQVLAPEERITIEQALTLYTRNGAYAGFEERLKGSLAPGKLADFVVVDRDVLSVPTDELKDVEVLQSWVGGQQIYGKSSGVRNDQ